MNDLGAEGEISYVFAVVDWGGQTMEYVGMVQLSLELILQEQSGLDKLFCRVDKIGRTF